MDHPITQSSPDSFSNEDEIDLRRYIEILIRWWREILFLTILLPILTVIVLLLWQLLGPATYVATSSIVVARSTIGTTADEYSTEFANALIGLAYSGSIAQNVILELGDLLDEDEAMPGVLLENIEVGNKNALPNTSGNSDLIAVTAKASSPEKAAAIANSWATHYVTYVYNVYGQLPDQLLDSMQTELDIAEGDLQQAQAELDAFVARSPILMLKSQITGTLSIADSLIVSQQSVALSLLEIQDTEKATRLENTYELQRHYQNLHSAAKLMAAQITISPNSTASTNLLPLTLLKSQAVTLSSAGAIQLDLGTFLTENVTSEELKQDIDAFIGSLEEQLEAIATTIATLPDEVLSEAVSLPKGTFAMSQESSSELDEVGAQLRMLQAELEKEETTYRILSEKRDLAWQMWTTLRGRINETSLAQRSMRSQVRLASLAVPPHKSRESIGLLTATPLAALIGLLIGVSCAFLGEFIGRGPFLAR